MHLMVRFMMIILRFWINLPIRIGKYIKQKGKNGWERLVNVVEFVKEEREDSRFWTGKGLMSGKAWDRAGSRMWGDIGRKLNSAIREGAYETRREVERDTEQVAEVLAEVDEAEQMMKAAGVVLIDARPGRGGLGTIVMGSTRRKRLGDSGKEKLKSGMLRLKAFKWMSKGVRGAEHRREAWLFEYGRHREGWIDPELVEEGLAGDELFKEKAWDYRGLEQPVPVTEIHVGADEIEVMEWPKIGVEGVAFAEGLSGYTWDDVVSGRVARELELRRTTPKPQVGEPTRLANDYTQQGIESGAIVERQVYGNEVTGTGRSVPRTSLVVGRGHGKTRAAKLTDEIMVQNGYDVEDVPGGKIYRKRLG